MAERHAGLDPRYTFEEFVIGPHNRFPHAAAQAVSENLGKAYNPLFLYGSVGIGKTHLMHAVGHRVLTREPGAQVLYVTTEQFMSEVIDNLKTGNLKAFREKYRSLDLLLVDDIQFLASSESTQEEFFHTFNELHQNSKQIIMTSDRPPKMLTTLEDRLRSRFEWGLIADIKAPSLETRVAILRKKEENLAGVKLQEDIRLYIAGKLKSNVRELEGFLKRVHAYAKLNDQPVTLPLVKEIMRELLPPDQWDDEDRAAMVGETVPPPPSAARPAPPLAAAPSAAPFPPAPVEPPRPVTPAVSRSAISIDETPVLPPAPPPAPAEPSVKSIPIAFFYPEGKDDELKTLKTKFDDVVKKHKLKFQLDISLEKPYVPDESVSYLGFIEQCRERNLRIAIVLGPPPDGRLIPQDFHQRIQEAFDAEHLSLQLIPWEELGKDYRYLNVALDITLVRFKDKIK